MSEPVKVGVVGLGGRGFWLSHCAGRCGEVTVTAVADIDQNMLEIAREKLPGVERYASGEEMAREADIEAIIVTTGDRFHAGNAREAFQHKKHVLIEKPMAQSFEDIVEIARLQKQTGLTVGTFLELRHGPIFRRAKEILESGEIGRLLAATVIDHVGRDQAQFFSIEKMRARDSVVSLVVQKGVHSLDLLNWFMDDTPVRVGAVGGLLHFGGDRPADLVCPECPEKKTCPHANTTTSWELGSIGLKLDRPARTCVWSEACDVEDVSFLNIAYRSGRVAQYSEVHFAPYYGLHFMLYGDKAQMDIEANHDTGEAWIQITERFTRKQRRERPSRDTGHGNADGDLIADFARAIREGRQPLSDLRAGFESAAIAVATRKSLDAGQFVDLPLLDEIGA